jgi:alpha-ketoglutarate-dependent taurine dioxygenase
MKTQLSHSQLDKNFSNVIEAFNTAGWCLITGCPPEQGRPLLETLGTHFGQPVFHEQSDSKGVHPIRYVEGKKEYANANCDDLPLHTDGTFETRPPAAMIMRCIQPANRGGESHLLDGTEFFERVVAEHSPALTALTAEDCFTIRRDQKQASKPLFRPTPTGLHLFFRYDPGVNIQVKPECVAAFRDLASYGDARKFKFNLEANDILVFDNSRMLHGRGAFDRTSNRHIEGLWLDGLNGDPRVRFGIKRALPTA